MRPHLLALTSAAALAAALLVAPRAARPCSPPLGPSTRTVVPPPGTVGVPTNTRIHYKLDWPPTNFTPQLVLRPSGGGDAIGLSGDPLVPDTPLAPNTTYELLDDVVFGSNDPGPLTVFATFTTGAGADTTAPPAPSAIVVDAPTFDDQTGNSCGSYTAVRQSISFAQAPEEILYVEIITPLGKLGRHFGMRGAGLVTYCSDPQGVGFPFAYGTETIAGTHQVRVMDRAGNLSAASTFEATLSCDGPGGAPDAGPDPGGDDDSGADGGDGDGSGCSTTGSTSAGSALALLALAGVLRQRRRDRR